MEARIAYSCLSHYYRGGKTKQPYHVQILVLVQIVDLEEVLGFEAVALAALQEHLHILPLCARAKKKREEISREKDTLVDDLYYTKNRV